MEVAELERRHVADAARMCARAFDDYPFLTALFPGPGSRRIRVSRRVYGAIVGDCVAHGSVHGIVEGGQVIGLAAWLPPGRYPLSLLRQLRQVPVAAAVLTSFPHRAALGLRSNVRMERRHPRDPHWYLAVIAVDPAHQGLGLGRAVAAPGLELADELAEPCFLETAKERNAEWYTRLGFQTQAVEPIFDGGPDQWYMWRPPQSVSSTQGR